MILIADSGSTKTTWCLIKSLENVVEFVTEGYNPNYVSQAYIVSSLRIALPQSIDWSQVRNVYFYGAGCSEERYDFMHMALQQVFVNAEIEIAMDLLASARALLGHKAGFAAILGTGTNSCMYDGERITCNIDSLGFILGDEGSGGYIGKKLLVDYIRGNMPAEINRLFKESFHLSSNEIIEQVYTRPMPNRYCASFCRFISANGHPYLRKVVMDAFSSFFENIVCLYPDYSRYALNCVGSVGFHFKDILAEVAMRYGMGLGTIIPNPMKNLVHYHLKA